MIIDYRKLINKYQDYCAISFDRAKGAVIIYSQGWGRRENRWVIQKLEDRKVG